MSDTSPVPPPGGPTRPLMTQVGSNKRLACYLVGAECSFFLSAATSPPHGWKIVLLIVGLIAAGAVTYRSYIDGSDSEAKTGQPQVPASPAQAVATMPPGAPQSASDAASAPAPTAAAPAPLPQNGDNP